MESIDTREVEAPLVVGENPQTHARDVNILSFAFFFIFLAFGAAQNLESTVNNVVGNLISLVLLRDDKGKGGNVGGSTLLYTVFLGSMTIGTILMCFLCKRDDKAKDASATTSFYSSVGSVLKLVVSPLCDKRMLLIIPLLAYSGLQQAFVWADFTKHIVEPALGVAGVGGVMALFGAANVISSLAARRFTSGLSSVTLTVSGGAFLQILVLLWLLLKYSLTEGLLSTISPILMAIIWGVGDGVFNTQLNPILAMLFKHDTEAIFAQLKVWQSAAISLVFFLSPYIPFQTMLLAMIASLCVSVGSFLFLTLQVEKAFGSESS